ncbi:MAG TPA: molybdopterin cofactor-binding domain-containing protein [Caulobacteraceae bacterium]|jgi:isoquinoline 1-oxidoreductase beta subunit|nr:molybdopterin cofactor-binding domain-containing protein [Caulobacteraceae bacterium]
MLDRSQASTAPSDPLAEDRLAPSRRGVVGMAAASAFLFGFHAPIGGRSQAAEGGTFAPNAFIKIDKQGDVTLIMPQTEMGQGVYTSISMILAEELDADWSRVKYEHAPPDEAHYANPMLGMQATGNSNSVRAFWKPLRQAGANARAMLVQAAASQMRVPASELRTQDSQVIHDASGRKLAYAALVGPASMQTPVANAPLKDPKDFRLIGRPLKRLDTPDKTNGKAQYGIDAMPPGVKFATLAASPVLGGKVAHVDDTAAKAVPGVRQVVVLDDLVAVVGDHMWAAKCGLEALAVTWDDGPNAQITSGEIWTRLRRASDREGATAKQRGDVAKALGSGDAYTQRYEMPLLAHACMEPMNCTVHVTPGKAEAWIGSQVMERAHKAVAKGANLPEEAVTVHNHLIGGGFGRRLEPDMALSAARVAVHVDGPVKVVWTREEDIRHDYYRPAYHDVLSARLDGERIVGWKHRVTGSAVMARFAPPFFQKGVDPDGVDSAQDIPYDIDNLLVEFNREEPPGINTGFWRGVGPNNNVFAIESFIDELARKAGKDPIAFRRAHLQSTPRLQAALDLVRDKSGWGGPLPPRCGRGVAAQISFASFIATVVECEVDEAGEVKLRRVTSAVDTGTVVNPDTVIAQLQSGLVFGLSAGLYDEVTLEKGRVQQSNFHDYRVLRIDQTPPIEVHLIRNGEAPGGIGETGSTASIPALRNAIYAATGVPLRRMPIDRALLAKGGRS